MFSDDTFIGRDKEQRELQQALKALKNGSGGLILLSGEAGIGKTCLAEACLATSDSQVYRGTAVEEATSPYSPVTAALRSARRHQPDLFLECDNLLPYLFLILPELGTAPGIQRSRYFV